MHNIIYLLKKLRLFYRYRHNIDRVRAIDKYLRYIKFADVKGDYFEFGVYAGETFRYVYHSAQLRGQTGLKFFAFDSFQGFSEVNAYDNTGVLEAGGRSFSLEAFKEKLQQEGIIDSNVKIVPGWLDDTLKGVGASETEKIVGDSKVAIAYMDVDLYEPTKTALDYVTNKLSDGAIVCFDNWFLLKGHPQRGERRAFSEWIQENPDLLITPYEQYGWHGMTFIVNRPL